MSTDHNFWRERRAEADSNRGPSAYQPNNALPLGQAGSQGAGNLQLLFYSSTLIHLVLNVTCIDQLCLLSAFLWCGYWSNHVMCWDSMQITKGIPVHWLEKVGHMMYTVVTRCRRDSISITTVLEFEQSGRWKLVTWYTDWQEKSSHVVQKRFNTHYYSIGTRAEW